MADAARTDQNYVTLDEYYEILSKSDWRYEWYDGLMWPVGNPDNLPHLMAGASPAHNQIKSNTEFSLNAQLRSGPCRANSSDLAVRVEESDMISYPDVVVFCEEARFEKVKGFHALLDPRIIVEVLSPSTAQFDLSAKFSHYQLIPSLQDYIVIFPGQVLVEHYHREDDGNWIKRTYRTLTDNLSLPEVNCSLAIADIYDRVPPGDEIRLMPRPRAI
jgi:Uma2 family endonuclease